MKKTFIVALLICLVIGTLSVSAIAADKIERGAKNTLLGWTEIPNTIIRVTKDTDNPFLGITVGLFKGVANAFARTTSGVVDVITFPTGSKDPAIKESMVDVGSGTK